MDLYSRLYKNQSLQDERNYGLGMDALVKSYSLNGITVWASGRLGLNKPRHDRCKPRSHGGSEKGASMAMYTLVMVWAWMLWYDRTHSRMNGIMVWAWMLG